MRQRQDGYILNHENTWAQNPGKILSQILYIDWLTSMEIHYWPIKNILWRFCKFSVVALLVYEMKAGLTVRISALQTGQGCSSRSRVSAHCLQAHTCPQSSRITSLPAVRQTTQCKALEAPSSSAAGREAIGGLVDLAQGWYLLC